MRSVIFKSGLALLSLLLVEGVVAAADAPPGLEQRLTQKGKTLLSLADGESATLYGKA